jgi:O-antigen/teichoic acid export membrane protein
MNSRSLLTRSLHAMSWSYLGVALNVIFQIAASILFARTLGTQITGVFAFGLLVFPPFRFICEFGLGSALIEKAQLDGGDVQMALTRSLLLAVTMAIAWLLCITPLAGLMHQKEYVTALNCFAVVLLCFPIQTICTSILTKHLEQGFLQASTLLAYAVGYLGIGAFGAFRGWGVWSLTLGFVAQNLMVTVLLLIHSNMSLKLKFGGNAEFLWRFGSRATAINISNWLTSSLDNMAVAWFFGTRTLGIYSVAYALVRAPADRVVITLQSVLFPASVLSRDNRERLAKASVACLEAVFMLTAPAFCAIALLSHTVIDALYGNAWRAAALVLPPFALAMIFHCISVLVSALLWGSGGINRDMKLQWLSAALLLVGVLAAAQLSFVAVAWIVLPITVMRAAWGVRALTLTVMIPAGRIARAFVCGAATVILVTPCLLTLDKYLEGDGVPALDRLLLEIALGALLWCLAFGLLHSRIMTPDLRAGLQSIRTALAGDSSHA